MIDHADSAFPIPRPATILADLPCFACGYNLRSIAMDGVCPECGRRVRYSIEHGWLQFADRGWLRTLRTAVTMLVWLLLMGFVGYIALAVYMVLNTLPSGQPPLRAAQIVGPILGVVTTAWGLWCVWRLTTPEPGRDPGLWIGSWIRLLCLTCLLSTGIYCYFAISGDLFSLDHTAPSSGSRQVLAVLIFAVLAVLAGLASSVGFFLLLVHMRRIARRAPGKGLGKLMSFLVWGMVAAVALWLLMMVPALVSARRIQGALGGPAATSQLVALGYLTPTTMPASGPAAVPGATATTAPSVAGGSSSTNAPLGTASPTTSPAGTAGSLASPAPFGIGFMVFMALMCVGELFFFAWFVACIVALVWFRRVFSKALQ